MITRATDSSNIGHLETMNKLTTDRLASITPQFIVDQFSSVQCRIGNEMANFKTLYSFVFLVLVQGLYSYQIVSAVDDHEPSYDEYAKMARYIVHKVGE